MIYQTWVRERLGKLYNLLETGKLDIDDLAPRIKELKAQINVLEKNRIEVDEETSSPSSIPFKMNMLKYYIEDFTALLNHPEVQIDYTSLLSIRKAEPPKRKFCL